MSKKKPKKIQLDAGNMGPGKTMLLKSPEQVKDDQKKARELVINAPGGPRDQLAFMNALAALALNIAEGKKVAQPADPNAKVDTKCPNCKLRLTIPAKNATHCILCGHKELETKPSVHLV